TAAFPSDARCVYDCRPARWRPPLVLLGGRLPLRAPSGWGRLSQGAGEKPSGIAHRAARRWVSTVAQMGLRIAMLDWSAAPGASATLAIATGDARRERLLTGAFGVEGPCADGRPRAGLWRVPDAA